MRKSTPVSRVRRPAEQRGHLLLLAVILIVVVMVMGFSSVSAVGSAKGEHGSAQARMKRLYLAESGLDAAMANLRTGGTGTLGGSTLPIALGQGAFWTVTTDLGDGVFRIVSRGQYAGGVRVLQGRVRRSNPVFHHAVFAGNSSEDPNYTMEFGGSGSQADQITGGVYSGGNIEVVDDAALGGEVRAEGTITGATGTAGVSQPGFDFRGVDFGGTGVVDVAAEFSAEGYAASDDAGGLADQLPATNPAHIFRRNPDDRLTEINGTTKNDYFLEDPYEVVGVDPSDNGTDPYYFSIDDGSGETRRVYYIDGNLWIHNRPTLSFKLRTAAGSGVQVTFVVRGNITFSDSVRVEDTDNDALAFIALEDPDVPDSGNIYFGDPTGGTLKFMQAYMYAEHDFLDVNLDASGSKEVTVVGAMTAGNHVAIERTYGTAHSKLTVQWDGRLDTGTVTLPLISAEVPQNGWALEAWAEFSPDAP
jgi:type II secretory pathway pseudopilin PulG